MICTFDLAYTLLHEKWQEIGLLTSPYLCKSPLAIAAAPDALNERGRMDMTLAGQKGRKVFYGWWIVLVTGIGLFLHYGPIIAFTFGVFLKPLNQEEP